MGPADSALLSVAEMATWCGFEGGPMNTDQHDMKTSSRRKFLIFGANKKWSEPAIMQFKAKLHPDDQTKKIIDQSGRKMIQIKETDLT